MSLYSETLYRLWANHLLSLMLHHVLSRETSNTKFIVFDLPGPGIAYMTHTLDTNTLTITPLQWFVCLLSARMLFNQKLNYYYFSIILFSNLLILSVPNTTYSRNASSTLNSISKYYYFLLYTHVYLLVDFLPICTALNCQFSIRGSSRIQHNLHFSH